MCRKRHCVAKVLQGLTRVGLLHAACGRFAGEQTEKGSFDSPRPTGRRVGWGFRAL